MNTQLAFAFGMLAMVAIVMLIVLVAGIVKVIKHGKQFNRIQADIDFIHRAISDTEGNVYREINEVRKNFDQYSDHMKRELMAYTDSRIDKTLGTKEKQLIKS